MQFALAITVHDPEARIVKKAERHIYKSAALYCARVANCTHTTHPKTIELLISIIVILIGLFIGLSITMMS